MKDYNEMNAKEKELFINKHSIRTNEDLERVLNKPIKMFEVM